MINPETENPDMPERSEPLWLLRREQLGLKAQIADILNKGEIPDYRVKVAQWDDETVSWNTQTNVLRYENPNKVKEENMPILDSRIFAIIVSCSLNGERLSEKELHRRTVGIYERPFTSSVRNRVHAIRQILDTFRPDLAQTLLPRRE